MCRFLFGKHYSLWDMSVFMLVGALISMQRYTVATIVLVCGATISGLMD